RLPGKRRQRGPGGGGGKGRPPGGGPAAARPGAGDYATAVRAGRPPGTHPEGGRRPYRDFPVRHIPAGKADFKATGGGTSGGIKSDSPKRKNGAGAEGMQKLAASKV